MLSWMLYALAVALLLSLAAWLAEPATRERRAGASRWVWLAALVGSVLLSALAAPLPGAWRWARPAMPASARPLADQPVAARLTALLVLPQPDDDALPDYTDRLLRGLCAASSAALLLVLAANAALVLRRKRQWRPTRMGSSAAPVYLAPDVGPAVVGLLRPRIVLPQWLGSAPAAQQALVLAHEQAHLDARDPQLLSLCLCLLVLMPWNLPLWWQLRRLRRAIEVDCDARVLARGHSLADYGETLLSVGERQSVLVGMAAAMSEPSSFLEQRICIMLKKKPSGLSRVLALLLACLSLAVAALAAEVSPPQPSALDVKLLQGFEGYYRSAGQEVIHITREGQRLFMQFTGRPRQEIWAASADELMDAKGKPAATATRDAQGQATHLVMHRRSLNFDAQRISAAQAEQIADAVAAKIRKQEASPGTEAALRRMFAQVMMDPVKLDGIGPLVAAGIKEQNDELRPQFKKLGAVRSVDFMGVSETGADQYVMRFENGSMLWQIALETDGSISRVTFHPL
jgi:hypothetical protein